jgi:3'(2'), 5'-bisphosphate nucleotidase
VSEQSRLTAILEVMIEVGREAGELVLPLFQDGCSSKIKADGSIVTLADTQGEALITSRLRAAFPDVALLGEESDAAGAAPDLSGPYFCVDPIDGTKQFASGDPQWVIAIAYLEAGRPLAGVIIAPALEGKIYAGLADFGGFEQSGAGERVPFPLAQRPKGPWHVLRGGHDTPESVAPHLPIDQDFTMTKISSALKFGMIAAGQGDIFIRAGRVWDWDIAAGQALIEAAGGRVLDLDGHALVYGQAQNGYRHPPFIARGGGVVD